MRKYILGLIILLSCVSLSAQLDAQKIREKFENYQTQSSRQILHLSLNQPLYHVKDTVFFKAYLTEENRQLTENKHVAIAELHGQNGLVKRIRFEISDGYGINQLILPEGLNPGIYKLVAFTSWMKNFDSKYLFQTQIKIINDKDVGFTQNRVIETQIEGGNLVNGLKSRIIVGTLKPNTEIELLANGEVTQNTETNTCGIGVFEIMPSLNTNYQVRIANSAEVQNLTSVKQAGVIMRVSERLASELKVEIETANLTSQATLLALSNGALLESKSIEINGKKVHTVDLSSIDKGKIHFSLLGQNGQLISYLNTFHETKGYDSKPIALEVSEIRQEVSIDRDDLQITDDTDNFHVSVSNASLFNERMNLLEDELFYFADSPFDYVLDRSSSNWDEDLHHYLTLSDDVPKWNEILFRDTYPKVHAKDNLIRRIAIARDSLGQPLERGSRVMVYFHNEYIRLEGLTGANGKIRFHFPGIEEESEMMYSAISRKKRPIRGVRLEWLPEVFPEIANPSKSKETAISHEYGLYATKRNQISNSYNYFGESDDTIQDTVRLNFMDEFEKNVIATNDIFKTEDYELFPTMKEFLNEVISPIQAYNSFGRTVIRVKSLRDDRNTDDDPLFIIDGIATKNVPYILSLDPKLIEEIRVIRDPRDLNLFSTMGEHGIVLMKSYQGGLREEIDPNNIIQGLNPVLQKKNVNLTGTEQAPVFDSNVYWNPTWTSSESLRFIQSNDIGKMRIRVEGFQSGKPKSYWFEYESKLKSNDD